MFSALTVLIPLAFYLLITVLLVVFVLSGRRAARAHEDMARAQMEIAKHLASLASEVKHLTRDK